MISKEQLEDLYINQKKTGKEIAEELNVSISQVFDYLYKYEFKKHKIKNICINCGKEFNPPRAHPKQKFCSYECSRQAKCVLKPKTCPQCGKLFQPRISNNKYCSKKCSDDAKRGKLKTGYYTTCLQCGKVFKTMPSENAKFCCYKCYKEGLKLKKVKVNHKHGTYEEIYGYEKAEFIKNKQRKYKPTKEAIAAIIAKLTGRKRSKETREKLRQIQLSPEHQKKIYNTKKKNHTFKSSNPENKIKDLLENKFFNVECQYKSAKYPFQCDFYIPSLDLYIEYQGDPSHGKEPYNPDNDKHLEKVKFWKEKAIEKETKIGKKSRYTNFIEVWTYRDPLKRETARKNNLNWIEFFSMNEFMLWFEKQ